MKILKWAGVALGALVIVAGTLYLLRTDPINRISGKRLSGDEQPYPADWSMCNDHPTIAVEARVEDPHSVTTVCFLHDGDLIVPALNGSEKQWPAMVARDPRIRVKIGNAVYPARADRLTDASMPEVLASMAAKYPQIADRDPADAPRDLWLFRITAR
ncbi:MAG: nitroreductase family deazaflavin-dependent oxidoreductase [Gammaproteobacteria bacterium]|nr:nitroreductase family deazaflavin-dependent oxidoreductase [Gammaproteobacteria bacterium]